MNKIILIESKSQAEEYLKNRGKFEEAIPITFDFESEELLLNAKMKFKTEEDYETETIYRGIYDLYLKNTEEICEKIKIDYRGIDLFQLFYMDLFRFLGKSRRYLILLEKIKKIENPKEVITLRNKFNLEIDEEICSKTAKAVFKDKLKEIEYYDKSKKESVLIKFAGFVQKVFSQIKLSLLNSKHNKIFFDDSKARIELLLKELNKTKRNKLFRCNNQLQKSFLVDGKYVPFYEFNSRKSVHQKKLLKEIEEFKIKNRDFKFLDDLNIEENLKPILEEWINYYLKFKFLEISGTINHMITLIEKKKIDIIVLFADSEPFGKAFTQVGKLFNIPSVVVLHGLLGGGISPGFVPFSADYILPYGNGSKKRLNKLGIPNEKIIVTGSQQFDKYFNVKKIKKNPKKVVFITACPTSHNTLPEVVQSKKEIKRFYRILYGAMKKFPEYKLVVKGRKGWDMNGLPLIVAKQENYKIEFIEDINPIKLLFDAEIIIVNETTMVMDGLLLGARAISYWFKNLERFGGYKNSKAIKTVYTPKSFEKAIRECIENKKRENEEEVKKYLEEELYKLDGKASERIVNFIGELISKKTK